MISRNFWSIYSLFVDSAETRKSILPFSFHITHLLPSETNLMDSDFFSGTNDGPKSARNPKISIHENKQQCLTWNFGTIYQNQWEVAILSTKLSTRKERWYFQTRSNTYNQKSAHMVQINPTSSVAILFCGCHLQTPVPFDRFKFEVWRFEGATKKSCVWDTTYMRVRLTCTLCTHT